MSNTADVTTTAPHEAFDQLTEWARTRGTSQKALQAGHSGCAAALSYQRIIPDQSAAFPNQRVEVRLGLHVVDTGDGRLVLRLAAHWTSIYGSHCSIMEYEATKTGDGVTIVRRMKQDVPTPKLDNIAIHTGNVSVGAYHNTSLKALRATGPVSAMLWDGVERMVPGQELVDIAEVVLECVPEL
ncbi:MAG TPA: hypothetical protein VJM32_03695 [Candidatus Saccharimonadales bacterium]|nr:hypothetical protein [Candidatus Saccharimonadales bacterium]